MCTVSMVSDHTMWPQPGIPVPPAWPPGFSRPNLPAPAPVRELSEADIARIVEALRAAREFDVRNGQEDCPSEDKVAWLESVIERLCDFMVEASKARDSNRVTEISKAVRLLSEIKTAMEPRP